MVLGMGVVFVFLILIYFAITCLSSILAPVTAKELADSVQRRPKAPAAARPTDTRNLEGDTKLIAVITGAIAAYRANR